MKKRSWEKYVDYLSLYNEKTDWVFRDNPYKEFFQFPEHREDFRDQIDRNLMRDRIMMMLQTLTERERRVIIGRFGLDDGTPKEAHKIAEIWHVTVTRILQIEAKAMRKLRHPGRRKFIVEPEQYQKEQEEIAKEQEELALREIEREILWKERQELERKNAEEWRKRVMKEHNDRVEKQRQEYNISDLVLHARTENTVKERPYRYCFITRKKIYLDE